MPGYPRIDRGEGLVRSHDLLEALRADIGAAYEALEADRSSQYLRRCVARAVFSFIEAVIECIKIELRSTIRLGRFREDLLSSREIETLGSLSVISAPPGKFLPLDQNIKRTFKLAAKVWKLNFRLNTGGEDFRYFLAAKSARNRLTHPRTYYDIEVTDDDMHCYSAAGMWVQGEFLRLFRTQLKSLSETWPEDERNRLLERTDFIQEPDA